MKGIILAGGVAKRLFPLTKVINKHILPVYDRPMLYYPLETLKSAGINDIMIVTGTHHSGEIFNHFGSGKDFGVKFTYRVQDEAGGIPQAISLAEDFVGTDKFVSINGDNILTHSIKKFVDEFGKGKEEARILLYKGTEEQAKKSGIAVIAKQGNVKELIEKPHVPPSTMISIGVYMYTPDVFKVIRPLRPSARGETEITHVNSHYLKKGTLKASVIEGEWLDAGTIDELWESNVRMKEISEKQSKNYKYK